MRTWITLPVSHSYVGLIVKGLLSQKTQNVDPILVYCSYSFADGEPTV